MLFSPLTLSLSLLASLPLLSLSLLSLFLSLYLSMCLSISLSLCLTLSLSLSHYVVGLSRTPSLSFSLSVSVSLSPSLSNCLSVCLSVCLSLSSLSSSLSLHLSQTGLEQGTHRVPAGGGCIWRMAVRTVIFHRELYNLVATTLAFACLAGNHPRISRKTSRKSTREMCEKTTLPRNLPRIVRKVVEKTSRCVRPLKMTFISASPKGHDIWPKSARENKGLSPKIFSITSQFWNGCPLEGFFGGCARAVHPCGLGDSSRFNL